MPITILGLRLRAAAAMLVMSGLATASCGTSERGSPSGPSPLSSAAGPGIARSIAYPSAGGPGRSVITFPPRDQPNAFFQDLVAYYRDVLQREPSPTYVDPEGQNVWLTEYFRFYLNGCPHEEAITRTLSEITSGGSQPVCGAETPTFPPRNLPYEFQGQLEATYRDVLGREQMTSYVDSEGANVWLAQYLRFRVTGGCDHLTAEGKVFLEIVGAGVQPECPVCTGPPNSPGGQISWTSALPPGMLRLFWNAATGIVTSYVVELGTTQGASDIAVIDTGTAGTSYTFTGLSPGFYFARVRAKNSCGISGPSREAFPRVYN